MKFWCITCHISKTYDEGWRSLMTSLHGSRIHNESNCLVGNPLRFPMQYFLRTRFNKDKGFLGGKDVQKFYLSVLLTRPNVLATKKLETDWTCKAGWLTLFTSTWSAKLLSRLQWWHGNLESYVLALRCSQENNTKPHCVISTVISRSICKERGISSPYAPESTLSDNKIQKRATFCIHMARLALKMLTS